jgi:hypothetical protein
MTEKQLRWQKRNRILCRLKGMVGFPFEEGVLTPLENDRLNTAFGIIRGVVPDVVRLKYSLEFKNFFTSLQDCIERNSKRPNPIGEKVIRKTYEKYKDILKV